MTEREPYRDLNMEQSLNLKDQLDNRYWEAVEFLGSVVADRSYLMNHIKSLLSEGRYE